MTAPFDAAAARAACEAFIEGRNCDFDAIEVREHFIRVARAALPLALAEIERLQKRQTFIEADPVAMAFLTDGPGAGLVAFAREVKEALGPLWDTTDEGPSAGDDIRRLITERQAALDHIAALTAKLAAADLLANACDVLLLSDDPQAMAPRHLILKRMNAYRGTR